MRYKVNKFFSYIAKLIFLSVIAAPLWRISYFGLFLLLWGVLGALILAVLYPLFVFAFVNIAYFLQGKDTYDGVNKSFWKKFISTVHLTLPAAFVGYQLFEVIT